MELIRQAERRKRILLLYLFLLQFLVFAFCPQAEALLEDDGVGNRASIAEIESEHAPRLSSESFVLPANLVTIEDQAFEGTAAETVSFPESLCYIGNAAFGGALSLRQIQVPASVTYIADNAFAGAENLTVFGEAGSYAEAWARVNGFRFARSTAVAAAVDPGLSLLHTLAGLLVFIGLLQAEAEKRCVFQRLPEHCWINNPKERAALRVLSLDFP